MDTHDHLPRFCHRYNTSTLSESPSGHTRQCCRVRSDSASDVNSRHASGLGAGSLFPTLSPQPLSACMLACVRWWCVCVWGGVWDALLSSARGVAAFQHVFPTCSGKCRQQVTLLRRTMWSPGHALMKALWCWQTLLPQGGTSLDCSASLLLKKKLRATLWTLYCLIMSRLMSFPVKMVETKIQFWFTEHCTKNLKFKQENHWYLIAGGNFLQQTSDKGCRAFWNVQFSPQNCQIALHLKKKEKENFQSYVLFYISAFHLTLRPSLILSYYTSLSSPQSFNLVKPFFFFLKYRWWFYQRTQSYGNCSTLSVEMPEQNTSPCCFLMRAFRNCLGKANIPWPRSKLFLLRIKPKNLLRLTRILQHWPQPP